MTKLRKRLINAILSFRREPGQWGLSKRKDLFDGENRQAGTRASERHGGKPGMRRRLRSPEQSRQAVFAAVRAERSDVAAYARNTH